MIRLDISNTTSFRAHRSGWGYCMSKLQHLHSRHGIFVDDFIDKNFGWNIHNYYKNASTIPYEKPWVGIFHNPPIVYDWFDASNRPDGILKRKPFLDSLEYCKCIVCLSDYLANWLRSNLEVPIITVKHPTEIPPKKWDVHNFLKQKRKRVVQIGYWLRNMESIYRLKCDSKIKKIWLPSNEETALYTFEVYTKTKTNRKEEKYLESSVTIERLSNKKFDDLLSHCVVFLDLYDSSANNAIVESVARNTPILVNKHPAVEEYLGKDYPLYFDDLDHASEILYDHHLIIQAHNYLKNMDKKWISGNYFATNMATKIQEHI